MKRRREEHDAHHRDRQSQGRERQDDDQPQPGRCPRRSGAACAARRSRPASQPDALQQDLDALADTLALLDRPAELGVADQVIIVPNAVRQDGNDRAVLALLQDTYGNVMAAPIPVSVSIKYALNQRRPVSLLEPKGAATAAYRSLAERVLTVDEVTHA